MAHFIFSYGSLAHKDVAERTGKTLSFRPAKLKGYLRNFRVLVKGRRFAAAGVEEKQDASTLGILVEVPEEELLLFDEREFLYDRIELEPAQLELFEGEMPWGRFYLYVPQNPQPATEEIPLAQSYLDVMLEAYLNLGEGMAKQFLESTLDLDRPWVNDRGMPRYTRFLEKVDVERIDSFLRAELGDKMKRVEDTQGLYLRPQLLDSILATIAFFDLFDFPLTAEELITSLYRYDRPIHIKELKGALEHLVSCEKLSALKDFYVLPGREGIVEIRNGRRFIAEKLWNRTSLYGTYMRRVPFVEMIAVCNNLSYDNPSERSDIDLFIVVRPGRMWLARFWITVLLQFFGVRRHGHRIAGRFCLSFFVTSEALDLRRHALLPDDPYLAYWALNLKPIYGWPTYEKFREQNQEWLSEYGLRFDDRARVHMYHQSRSRMKGFLEWLLGGYLGKLIEGILKMTLKRKTLKKADQLSAEAGVVVTDEILKFHDHDRRDTYRKQWEEKLLELKRSDPEGGSG
ncbi:MAG: gamma-glutamylcyclotransferase [Candidatus Peregrinibacteria bacterium]|nr:gamma-glutamylcyclotransferase [Candidatus Peregrinibacteria bacterium]